MHTNMVTNLKTMHSKTFPIKPNKQKGILVTSSNNSCQKSPPDCLILRFTCKELAESQALSRKQLSALKTEPPDSGLTHWYRDYSPRLSQIQEAVRDQGGNLAWHSAYKFSGS